MLFGIVVIGLSLAEAIDSDDDDYFIGHDYLRRNLQLSGSSSQKDDSGPRLLVIILSVVIIACCLCACYSIRNCSSSNEDRPAKKKLNWLFGMAGFQSLQKRGGSSSNDPWTINIKSRPKRQQQILQPRAQKFLHTLRMYLDCREKMDAKYKEVDELQTLAKLQLKTDSGGIEVGDKFKPEYQQQSTRGDPVQNLSELYAAAEVAQPIFRALITKLCKDVTDFLGDDEESVNIEFADLKGKGFKHICEVQIHHAAIKYLTKLLNSHEYYEYFRAYYAGATDSLEERLEDLRAINSAGDSIDEQFVENLILSSYRNKTVANTQRLGRLGALLRDQLCEYRLAAFVYKRICEIRIDKHGAYGIPVGHAYHDLGFVFRQHGNYDVALAFYELSSIVKRRSVGLKHPSFARTYNHIAVTYHAKKDYSSASGFYKMAIELIENKPLANKEIVLADLNTNYAINITKQVGQAKTVEELSLENARTLHLQALETKERVYGKGHSSQAENLHGLGLIHYERKEYQDAIQMHNEELELRKNTIGNDHVTVARAYYRLAMAQRFTQRSEDVQSNCKTAVEIYQKTLADFNSELKEAKELLESLGSTVEA